MKKAVALLLALLIVLAFIPMGGAAQTVSVDKTSDTFKTSKHFTQECFSLKEQGGDIELTAQFKKQTDFMLVNIFGVNGGLAVFYEEYPVADNKAKLTLTPTLADGDYYLTVNARKSGGQYTNRYALKDVRIKAEGGELVFAQPKAVYDNNVSLAKQNAATQPPESYLDIALSYDYFVEGGLSAEEVALLNSTAAIAAGNAADDYEKALAVYEFITENIYYDTDGQESGADCEINPGALVRSYIDKANPKTNCDGYTALTVAMLRVLGIPARAVQGHVISTPESRWEAQDASSLNHSWAEAFIDGRWVIIDTTRGTGNRYLGGKYITEGTAGYQYFDADMEAFSYAYNAIRYRNGSLEGRYLSDEQEKAQLTEFLEYCEGGLASNGEKLNTAYNKLFPETWVRSEELYQTDGFGRLSYLDWHSETGTDEAAMLAGKLNLSGFEKLKNLFIYNNNITELELAGCVSLNKLSVNFNELTRLDAADAADITVLNAKENPLNYARFNANGSLVELKTQGLGELGFTYDNTGGKNELTLYAKAAPGYECAGWFSGDELISKANADGVKLAAGSYTAVFKVNGGYKYALYEGQTASWCEPYIRSAQYRLKELGYYAGEVNGIFDAAMGKATAAFRAANAIGVTEGGIYRIDETTWNKLFSESAKAINGLKYTNVVYKSGSTGDMVRVIEHRLGELGYLTEEPDKIYNTSTLRAVNAFRAANGATNLNGYVDSWCWGKLFNAGVKDITATSYLGSAKSGTKAARVYLIEQRLFNLGYFSDAPDKTYGTATVRAMKGFQTANGLSAGGTVGTATWNKLFSASAKRRQDVAYSVTLSQGQTNGRVIIAEQRLNELGYMTNTPDTYFGTATTAAVKAFQKQNGFSQTGKLAKGTWNKLMSDGAKANRSAALKKNLSSVTVAKQVYLVETRLIELGYMTGKPDYTFDNETKIAVKAFQAMMGKTTPNGTVDSWTWGKLNGGAYKITASYNKYKYLKQGNTHNKVILVETRLRQMGYFTASPDNYFGTATTAAVKDLQKANFWKTQSGIVAEQVWGLLF